MRVTRLTEPLRLCHARASVLTCASVRLMAGADEQSAGVPPTAPSQFELISVFFFSPLRGTDGLACCVTLFFHISRPRPIPNCLTSSAFHQTFGSGSRLSALPVPLRLEAASAIDSQVSAKRTRPICERRDRARAGPSPFIRSQKHLAAFVGHCANDFDFQSKSRMKNVRLFKTL